MFTGTAMHQMGTALRLAKRNGWPVEVLVEGRWLHGRVDALDARGVALDTPRGTPLDTPGAHTVVALERITRVRVLSAPERAPLVMRRISCT